MTLGEVERYLLSFQRREERRLREKALFDYKLADLIGISCGRIWANKIEYPEIYEIYPSIFQKEEVEEQREKMRMEKSIERLKDFVMKHNKKLNEEVSN
jgi:hypothetical protein